MNMNTNFLKRLWLAIRIWLVAVLINTVLGTLYLTDFTYSLYTGTILFAGLIWGTPFSFPVMIIIMAVMNRCMKDEMNGLQLFWGVFITGILMSVIMFLIFCGVVGFYGLDEMKFLFGAAVLSGIIAIAIHYRPLLKLGNSSTSIPERN
jgi:hypothetical protein